MNKIITYIPSIYQFPTRCNVAAYARVSSEKDAMLHSLAAQVSYYQNLIQGHPDWEYSGVYADEAMTGTKENRPEFQRMLSDCKSGLIEKVITKSISRFARNTVTLLETVRELKSIGVDVYFEEQEIHSMSGDGEFPQFYVEDSHEAIIPLSQFDEVQNEIANREKKYMPCPKTPVFSEFTSKIQCCSCGSYFRRKICNAGIYKWICSTYNTEGSSSCCIKPIPEEVLKQRSAEVLGKDQYNPVTFSENISGIYIPQNGTIEFEIKDGSRISLTWKYRSRSECWTSDMKAMARMKRKER